VLLCAAYVATPKCCLIELCLPEMHFDFHIEIQDAAVLMMLIYWEKTFIPYRKTQKPY
jgi:hypothetical protein